MATSQTRSPVAGSAVQDTPSDGILQQYPNAESAVFDASKANEVPPSQNKASSIYNPLAPGCIRVLRLQPAPRLEDPLVGTLDIVHLNDGTQYEALSYTWGTTFVNDKRLPAWITTNEARARYDRAFSTQPSKLGEISLCNSTVITAANLDAALRRLRYSGNIRSLWIDALCINQDDADERSAQVARIAQVFAHARQTIVWFGEDSVYCDGKFVFACCRKYEQNMNSTWRRTWRRAVEHGSFKIYMALGAARLKPDFFRDIWFKQPLLSWTADEQNRQFDLFSARLYFSRLWCVQEVASAVNVTVKCGDSEIPWSIFSAYVSHDNTLSGRMVSKLPAITEGSEHTFDKLVKCSGLQCSDERDYIYAISGLLRLCKNCPQIEIDYKLDWQTVFTDFARDYVMLNGYTAAWDVLTVAAGRRDAKLTSLMPSWVPDWRPKSSEIEGERLAESAIIALTRRYATAFERNCRTAGRNVTVTFDGRSMEIDLWCCGQLGEMAKSTLYSGHNLMKLEQTLEISDYLYSLPPEHKPERDPCLILRSCAGEKPVFQAIAVVSRHLSPKLPPATLEARNSFKEEMHRISII